MSLTWGSLRRVSGGPGANERENAPGPAAAGPGATWSAGVHEGTLSFTATTPGAYRYLCPVPGHAQKGMAGTFTVR
jgi:plastocyanin